MNALVLHEAGGPLTLEETPMPRPGPGECLVRVRACGLGLTLAWNRTDRVGAFPGRLPRIIGHEIAGDIAEVGEGVGDFKEGDRVNVGSGLVEVGGNLFEGRERLDDLDVDVGLVRAPEREGVGETMWERLYRAAEGGVIEVS